MLLITIYSVLCILTNGILTNLKNKFLKGIIIIYSDANNEHVKILPGVPSWQ
jgi:hypothetical protein